MSKKLITNLSLAVVLVVLMAISAFAADFTLYFDSPKPEKNSVAFGLAASGSQEYEYRSDNTAVAAVDQNGTITAVSAGTTVIRVYDKNNNINQIAAKTVEVKARALTSIAVTTEPAKLSYLTGEAFDPTGIKVTATYDSTDTVDLSASQISYTPMGPLNSGNTSVTISYTSGGVTKNAILRLTSVADVKTVEIVGLAAEYKQGDTLAAVKAKVTYNDATPTVKNLTSGFDIYVNGTKRSADYKLATSDTKVYVSVGGYRSAESTIKVKVQDSKITFSGTPTVRTYKVGDKLNFAGITGSVSNYGGNGSTYTLTSSMLATATVTPATFTTADVGQTTKTFTVTYQGYSGTLTLTGLTITGAQSSAVPTDIYRVDMLKTSYPIGYTFTAADVDRIYCKLNGSLTYIYGTRTPSSVAYSAFADYSAQIAIEVRDADNRAKISRYSTIIEEEDVYDYRGTDVVNLRFHFGVAYCDFTVEVGDSGFYFYHLGELITSYSNITDALDATVTQDVAVMSKFLLSTVRDRDTLVIKLGEDATISGRYTFTPARNVLIDLNGHTLTFYSDTVDFPRINYYTLEITNTAKNDAKFIYYDEDITVTLEKGDSLVYEYGEDDPVKGVTIEVDCGSNGTVTADPKLNAYDEVSVAKGSKVVFTITPKSGYEIDEVELDSEDVTKTAAYKLASTGIATLTISKVEEDAELKVTFKEEDKTPVWYNPFTDVSSGSSYYSAVRFVYQNDLFKGTSTTKFSPNSSMLRSTFVTVLGRLAKVDVTKYNKSSFTDVPLNSTTSWYAPYVEWAVQNGIIQGYGNGKFGPNDVITHQQMYVMMQRYASFVANVNTEANTTIPATDRSEIADWAMDAIRYAAKKDYLVLRSGRLDPEGPALRWELATLLETFCENVLEYNK